MRVMTRMKKGFHSEGPLYEWIQELLWAPFSLWCRDQKGLTCNAKPKHWVCGFDWPTDGTSPRLSTDQGGRFRNPLKEVLPTGQPIGKGDLEAFQNVKDEIVTIMTDNASYRNTLENINSEALSKRS
jgi:hypothetical protein